MRTVRRAGIGDQQGSALVHFQRRMDFRNARVIQIEIVISSAPDIQSPAAGNQRQRSFPQALRGADPRDEVNLVFVFLPHTFGSGAKFSLEILLLQLFFEFAKGRIDDNPASEDVDISFNFHGRERAIAMIIDVIDRRGQDFGFQPLQNFRRRFRMSAPFDFQFQMVGSDTAFALLVANPRVDQRVHAVNQVVGRHSRFWIDGATQLAIDYLADAFEYAPHQTLRQNRVASSL